jgi:hypothetical protein
MTMTDEAMQGQDVAEHMGVNGAGTIPAPRRRRPTRSSLPIDLVALREAAMAAEKASGEARAALLEGAKARRPIVLAELAEIDRLLGVEPRGGPDKPAPAPRKAAVRMPAKPVRPRKAKATKPSRKASSRKRGQSVDVGDVAAKVLGLLRDVGATGATIAELTSAGERGAIKAALAKGMAAGTVRATGQARGRRYFAVDEATAVGAEGATE